MSVVPSTAPDRGAAPPEAEMTTTIVIGSGFSALAVAAELNRQGVKAIVVDGACSLKQPSPIQPTTGGISLEELSERSEIVRLLEHYARRHELDIRPDTQALDLTRIASSSSRQWRVHTAEGTLNAHSVVFTRGALSQLRKVLHGVGVTGELRSSMHALGLYLVGVGNLEIPTTHEILHQAKRAGQSIAARVAARDVGFAAA
ncbi:glycine/D-amino acid oxidase-like deaminating enzyme [Arthrobacter stackebrandtii]|uniref:Glycine/D-amino acid oxidase-like deaminating enzyme n=1 Tax=Arthrobacter stackebrandtii TaxID=272161 RepID=A0ABS4YVZ3_9MICC|nr:FAD-binding protein [Arthrobacter stackebrandtii]MBP2412936.1 glycine/D-amino acid oxidase-like deaminating enzyme [Arthrobacter stackebrandtii]PYH01264.1 FAD-binding protein [Arthrobacter stackebrandtii]